VFLSPTKELWTRAAMVCAGAAGAAYLVWRVLWTLNPEAWTFSFLLWGAEAFGWLSAVLFFFTVWKVEYPSPPPAPEGLRVDVLVPTKGEPLWVLRRTLLAAQRIRYPHRTVVLDDSGRPEVRELAASLGCLYLSRPTHEHGKAGNLNFGLRHSSSDFVAVLDADHVPVPEFLDRILGYFRDPRVAFVQTPQEFYNLESYQHWTEPTTGRSWHEQALFFRVIQPGKNHWNAAFYCGSPAVLRRAALEDVGGFATETVTEDLHTSIRLHARGWKSVYHSEVLAYGLAPSTAQPYRIQRLRWGRGAMQVLRLDNPLWRRGLTLPQRLTYLASMITWFEGWQKAVLYVAPPAFYLTGQLPVRAVDWVFLLAFAAYHLLSNLAFKLASRGYGMVLLTEHYNMARFATYMRATLNLLTARAVFHVTPKAGHHQGPPLEALVPQPWCLPPTRPPRQAARCARHKRGTSSRPTPSTRRGQPGTLTSRPGPWRWRTAPGTGARCNGCAPGSRCGCSGREAGKRWGSFGTCTSREPGSSWGKPSPPLGQAPPSSFLCRRDGPTRTSSCRVRWWPYGAGAVPRRTEAVSGTPSWACGLRPRVHSRRRSS